MTYVCILTPSSEHNPTVILHLHVDKYRTVTPEDTRLQAVSLSQYHIHWLYRHHSVTMTFILLRASVNRASIYVTWR